MKNLFYFSRLERITLSILVLLIIAGVFFFNAYKNRKSRTTEVSLCDSSTELKNFLQSVHKEDKRHYYSKTPLFLHAFDPNRCDSFTLLQLGLKPWQIRVFMHYRQAGAVFRKKNDLERVYGLSEEDFRRIAPYAVFRDLPSSNFSADFYRSAFKKDSAHAFKHLYPEKLKVGETVDLNQADTILLKRIPGIGSYYARRIRQYGEQLGGYISIDQLKEIPDFPAQALAWFRISPQPVRKLSVNKTDFKGLVHHPYLSYEQVKAIFEHRRKYGKIMSIRQLSTEDAFSEGDLKRLEPYLSFE